MTANRAALYSGHCYPALIVAHAVWLYFRFPLSLRMVEEMLAERGIGVSHETIRRWGMNSGGTYAAEIRRRQTATGDKWRLDEVVISIAGKTHWLWRAGDQHGVVLDILVQSHRDARAARRLLRKLMKRQRRVPRVITTDEWRSGSSPRMTRSPISQRHRQTPPQTDVDE
ncbi:putative transposase [Palleronia aestuarii]|uniref:Putative transposase n=1 Tax=Palleronia aestuarii TaxID=568105 RepID=A0A2W7NMM4_9RHOB|nr:putative transposase [Palleronia aestuarii]